VVRTTAAEVRKRLIQYYYSPDHAGELVIELPLGSYVPSFRELAHHSSASASDDRQVAAEHVKWLPQHPMVSEIPLADSKRELARSAVYSYCVAFRFASWLRHWPRENSQSRHTPERALKSSAFLGANHRNFKSDYLLSRRTDRLCRSSKQNSPPDSCRRECQSECL
jgi:hypothetical protein